MNTEEGISVRTSETGPAKGQFCDKHFSWLCQAGQGECQRTDHLIAPTQGEDPYGEAFDLFEEIHAEQAVRNTRPKLTEPQRVCVLCDQPFGPEDVETTPPGTDDIVHVCCWYGGCEHPRTTNEPEQSGVADA